MKASLRILPGLTAALLTAASAQARPFILPSPTPTPPPTPAPWDEPPGTPTPSPTNAPLPQETPPPWETEETLPPPGPSLTPAPAPAATPGLAPLLLEVRTDPVSLTVHLLLASKQLGAYDQLVPAQASLGVGVTVAGTDWPVSVALDGFASAGSSSPTDAGDRYEASTAEYALGVRRLFDVGVARPFAGAGLEWVRATGAHVTTAGSVTTRTSDAGTGFGGWGEVGSLVRLGRLFDLGLYLRYDSAWVSVAGRNADAGGVQIGAVLGVGLGGAAIPPGIPLL